MIETGSIHGGRSDCGRAVDRTILYPFWMDRLPPARFVAAGAAAGKVPRSSHMRIAVSGSHSLGKSTVVNDWVAAHPEYRREEEPYRALSLAGPYEIRFRDASTRLQNGIQMYYSISRVHRFSACTADVIFDRAPVDYIAYSVYTARQSGCPNGPRR